VISHQGRYVFLCRHVHASIHNPILQVMNLLAKNTHNSFGTEVFLLPALGCGTPYHHICGRTWTTDISSMHWKDICLGCSRPRRIVTNLLSCALEDYLLTYLVSCRSGQRWTDWIL